MEKISFPFRKLRQDIYLTLEILMFAERSLALEFMFCVNKESRTFLHRHFISIQNGFINEGLIVHDLDI